MILDVEPEEDDEDEDDEDDDDENETGEERMRHAGGERRHHSRMPSDLSMIEGSAEMLYGLIHQRFICSRVGIQQMSEKYELSHFGVCPRTYCNLARTLPVGLSDVPGDDTVKLFCPSCLDVYVPPNSRFQTVDGAFFGRTFGALFLLTFPEYDLTKNGVEALATLTHDTSEGGTATQVVNGIYACNTAPGLGRGKIFEPKIYGFRVSETARSGPRMQWLRGKPDDITELDETRRYAEEHADSDDEDEDEVVDDDEEILSSSNTSNAAAATRSRAGAGAGARSDAPSPRRRQTAAGSTRLRQQQEATVPGSGEQLQLQGAQQRQHQNGSPMTVDANGAEAEL